MRRLRKNEALRDLVRETAVSPDDLIYPMFVTHGSAVKENVPSMPGVFRYSTDTLTPVLKELWNQGIKAVMFFGIPERKDSLASEAYADSGVVQRAVRAAKDAVPDMLVITDVCLCGYTDHGHCGIVVDGEIDNDATLEYLAQTALSHARAGADMVAPSDMMDGRVAAIRGALDAEGYKDVSILSYAAKYASSFYGPFREAASSAPKFGDRKTYQMDPANAREALREVELDIQEGADIVMVKPALAYLDIISRVKKLVRCPVAAYSVSGEYAMIKAAAEKGWLDEKNIVLEMLTAIKRAGADIILTYYAWEAAKWIQQGG